MYKITAPEKNYRGVTSGIVFDKGTAVAELDSFSKEWFIAKGYSVEETDEKPNTQGNEDSKKEDSKPKTKAELLEEAKELGIENIKAKITNAELEELISTKKAELEALNNNEDPENSTPVSGDENDNNVTDPEAGEQENEDSKGGE